MAGEGGAIYTSPLRALRPPTVSDPSIRASHHPKYLHMFTIFRLRSGFTTEDRNNFSRVELIPFCLEVKSGMPHNQHA
jgi:hypothetical protein